MAIAEGSASFGASGAALVVGQPSVPADGSVSEKTRATKAVNVTCDDPSNEMPRRRGRAGGLREGDAAVLLRVQLVEQFS
ncbi:hypothetical protein DIPPA_25643 [Diplonema papillatum]|nr:hypothetical protein DIPPA_25643 [Diplonema papillatum]